jgi:hypothetical protein
VSLKGDLRSLQSLRRALGKLPITASARIAQRAAPEVSALARDAYDGGRTVYGLPRPKGVDGDTLDLVRTGDSRRATQFTAEGTRMRTFVLPRYTKYLIARYSILPPGRAPLPLAWRERITSIAAAVLHEQIFGPR